MPPWRLVILTEPGQSAAGSHNTQAIAWQQASAGYALQHAPTMERSILVLKFAFASALSCNLLAVADAALAQAQTLAEVICRADTADLSVPLRRTCVGAGHCATEQLVNWQGTMSVRGPVVCSTSAKVARKKCRGVAWSCSLHMGSVLLPASLYTS